MAKGTLITNAQIKKAIKDCDWDECVDIVIEIAESCPQAREFLTLKFSEDQNDILEIPMTTPIVRRFLGNH